jgi:hypothetical protein
VRDITLRKKPRAPEVGYNALQNSGAAIAVADVEFRWPAT